MVYLKVKFLCDARLVGGKSTGIISSLGVRKCVDIGGGKFVPSEETWVPNEEDIEKKQRLAYYDARSVGWVHFFATAMADTEDELEFVRVKAPQRNFDSPGFTPAVDVQQRTDSREAFRQRAVTTANARAAALQNCKGASGKRRDGKENAREVKKKKASHQGRVMQHRRPDDTLSDNEGTPSSIPNTPRHSGIPNRNKKGRSLTSVLTNSPPSEEKNDASSLVVHQDTEGRPLLSQDRRRRPLSSHASGKFSSGIDTFSTATHEENSHQSAFKNTVSQAFHQNVGSNLAPSLHQPAFQSHTPQWNGNNSYFGAPECTMPYHTGSPFHNFSSSQPGQMQEMPGSCQSSSQPSTSTCAPSSFLTNVPQVPYMHQNSELDVTRFIPNAQEIFPRTAAYPHIQQAHLFNGGPYRSAGPNSTPIHPRAYDSELQQLPGTSQAASSTSQENSTTKATRQPIHEVASQSVGESGGPTAPVIVAEVGHDNTNTPPAAVVGEQHVNRERPTPPALHQPDVAVEGRGNAPAAALVGEQHVYRERPTPLALHQHDVPLEGRGNAPTAALVGEQHVNRERPTPLALHQHDVAVEGRGNAPAAALVGEQHVYRERPTPLALHQHDVPLEGRGNAPTAALVGEQHVNRERPTPLALHQHDVALEGRGNAPTAALVRKQHVTGERHALPAHHQPDAVVGREHPTEQQQLHNGRLNLHDLQNNLMEVVGNFFQRNAAPFAENVAHGEAGNAVELGGATHMPQRVHGNGAATVAAPNAVGDNSVAGLLLQAVQQLNATVGRMVPPLQEDAPLIPRAADPALQNRPAPQQPPVPIYEREAQIDGDALDLAMTAPTAGRRVTIIAQALWGTPTMARMYLKSPSNEFREITDVEMLCIRNLSNRIARESNRAQQVLDNKQFRRLMSHVLNEARRAINNEGARRHPNQNGQHHPGAPHAVEPEAEAVGVPDNEVILVEDENDDPQPLDVPVDPADVLHGPYLPQHYTECVVCLGHGICNREIQPCQHRCCADCGNYLLVCPLCRRNVYTVDEVEIVGPDAQYYEQLDMN